MKEPISAMPEDRRAAEAWPGQLLDDYVRIARFRAHDALPATALRTRSLAARTLLAHAATDGSRSLRQLLDMARTGGVRRARAARIRADVLGDLARVIALQEVSPDDASIGLALFDLTLATFGARRVTPKNQGVHAQLAFHLGRRARAASLCRTYRDIPDHIGADLALDLANPFPGPTSVGRENWLRGFRNLFPDPQPTLRDETGCAAFDLVAATCSRKLNGEPVSVIITTFQPGSSLLTTVRSLAEQSWSNLEILLIDDGSAPEYDGLLHRCAGHDDRVRLVRLPTNVGTYRARNAGLDLASARFVTFQDSDDWSHPRRIESQVRPLLENDTLVATMSDGLRVSEELILTRPGRDPRVTNTSSLMTRKDSVVDRIGYFDSVRKAADNEYLERIKAAFGDHAVHHVGAETLALIRQAPSSLSRAEFRAGWAHPARWAYRSAYRLWHEEIRSGRSVGQVPRDLTARPFPALAHLGGATGSAGGRRRYDVMFASDWRVFGGSQRSMFDEIRLLARRGKRVAILHLESYLLMTPYRKMLCRPVQRLVNDGVVDQLLLPDRVDVDLTIVQLPSVLQFAATDLSRIRSRRTLIIAKSAPVGRDGSDHQYSPTRCTDAAAQMFGADPLWCPGSAEVRASLAEELASAQLTPFDMPGVITTQEWATDRRRFRSDRPVLGRNSRDHRMRWPADRAAVLGAYPGSPEVDVRILGGAGAALRLLGVPDVPSNWLVFPPGDLGARAFLLQLDFYCYFPHPDSVETSGRAILEALASGCVAILPRGFSPIYGDAALYREPGEVMATVRGFFTEPNAVARQRERGFEWVRATCAEDTYLDTVLSSI